MSDTISFATDFNTTEFLQTFKRHLQEIPNLPSKQKASQSQSQPKQDDPQSSLFGARLQQALVSKEYSKPQHDFIEEDHNTGFQKRKNYLNLFQINRGPCRQCVYSGQQKCEQYRASFNIDQFRGLDLFQCVTCKCAMNSHAEIKPEQNFSNIICQQVNRRYINENHLNFKATIAIFFVDSEKYKSFDIDIENFVSSLNEGGFNILSFFDSDIYTLQSVLMLKSLYSRKCQIQKEKIKDYYNFLDDFFDLINMYGVKNENQQEKSIKSIQDKEILKYFLNLFKKTYKKLEFAIKQQMTPLIFLMTGNHQNLQVDLRKFFIAAKSQLPQDLVLFYLSRTKYKAFRDSLLLFPSFYKVSLVSFVINQQYKEDITKAQINDLFQDMLDFNNIKIIKQDFGQFTQSHFIDAFSPFMSNAEKFVNNSYIDKQMFLKIGCKVGPLNLTILSQNLPNFYRVTNQEQNHHICERLFQELYINQRILLIYRPIVVKSGLENILNYIWQINEFIVIDSEYRQLSLDDATMLAALERIYPINMTNYITMMTEGFCYIALLSKPGAFQTAQVIADGCDQGLKIKQTRRLQEVQITHETKNGSKYIEKLQMNFNNLFEAYTKASIFSSLKDVFDLEELVLQENQKHYNQNIFMNEDQVYLAPKLESSNTSITQQQRFTIIRDLPKQNYNFFCYTTQDELITEQLISLFLPQAAQIETIFIYVKPQLYSERSYQKVDDLLLRMRYTIFEKKEVKFDKTQAKNLINSLSSFEWNQSTLDNYVEYYSTSPFYVYCLMKPAGYKEMSQFMCKFNLVVHSQYNPTYVEDLKKVIIPCTNIPVIQDAQQLFNPILHTFDAETVQTQPPESIDYILKYILASSLGLQLDSFLYKLEYEESKNHFHYQVQSSEHGQYEIRIRRRFGESKHEIKYDQLLYHYELLSWYYRQINQCYPHRAPLTYQYRINYEERINNGNIDQIYDCQEYGGRNFITEVFRQIYDYGNDVFERLKHQQLNLLEVKAQKQVQRKDEKAFEALISQVAVQMQKKGKMVAYYWGVKLARFCKELEYIDCQEFNHQYGKILRSAKGYECQYKLAHNEHIKLEKDRITKEFELIYRYIQLQTEKDQSYGQESMMMQSSYIKVDQNSALMDRNKTVYEKKLKKLYNNIFPDGGVSIIFEYALSRENIRLLPRNIKVSNLRIIRDKEQVKVDRMGSTRRFDWSYEQTSAINHDVRNPYQNYMLSYCLPNIKSKFELVGDIMYMLNVDLKLQKHLNHYKVLEDPYITKQEVRNFDFTNERVRDSLQNLQKKPYFDQFAKSFESMKWPMLDEIIKGFDENYFLEEDTIKNIQQKFKESQINKKKQLPDLLHMFYFLKCIHMIYKYVKQHDAILDQMAKLTNQKNLVDIGQTKDELDKNKQRIDAKIKELLTYICNEQFQRNFFYDNTQAELKIKQNIQKQKQFDIDNWTIDVPQYDDDPEIRDMAIDDVLKKHFEEGKELQKQKQFIESKKYFQPLEQGNNNKEWGKLDQEAIDEEFHNINEERNRDIQVQMNDFLEKAPFYKDRQNDPIQKVWFENVKDTAMGKYIDTRPDNVKTGIYVDTVKTIDKKMDEKIDHAIKKFMMDKMNNFQKKQ